MSHPPCMVCGPDMALGGNNERLSGLYRFKKNTGCLWEFPPPLKGVCPFLKLENHRDKVRSASKSTKFQRRQWHPTPVLLPGKSHGQRGAWWAAVHGVAKSRKRLSDFTFTFHFHALEKEMATYCSVLAWRISGTVEPGGLPSLGSHRVGQD